MKRRSLVRVSFSHLCEHVKKKKIPNFQEFGLPPVIKLFEISCKKINGRDCKIEEISNYFSLVS
jgi:hypothetical protein